MGFASEWLQSGPVFPELIKEAPDKRTGIIVVVPSFDEPAVPNLLESIQACHRPECVVEVIIIVNSPLNSDNECLENNRLTLERVREWKKRANPFFRLYMLNIEKSEIKGWGVGLARKTGMDEALRRFNRIGKEEGIIACLDADCTVEKNYLTVVEKELLNRGDRKACSVYFEHPLIGTDYPPEIYNAAIQYELHLRYYIQALKYSEFPYVFHTVGSTIAVKALSYLKAGGMNRRQAGEDFYFVQKLVPAGGYFSLNSTTVFPSPRISFRVPFGTGAAIGKMINKRERELLTYNPGAFSDLKSFFQMNERYFFSDNENIGSLYSGFPASVRSFTGLDEWTAKMNEIRKNTSGLPAFKKRFFEWFNMFRIVKYLNFTHSSLFRRISVYDASLELMQKYGRTLSDTGPQSLLIYFRSLEKETG